MLPMDGLVEHSQTKKIILKSHLRESLFKVRIGGHGLDFRAKGESPAADNNKIRA